MPLGYIPGSHSGFYGNLSHRVFGSRRFSRAIEYRIIQRWLPTRRVQVLDVGAGDCELANQLALMGCRVTALDLNPDGLKRGRSPFVGEIEGLAADATTLPFPNESFDLVVCNSALEHFPNDVAALSEMARVLRKGGMVLVTTDSFPSRPSAWLKWIPRSWRKNEMQQCEDLLAGMQGFHREKHSVVNYYVADQLVDKVQRSGLKVVQWRYYANGAVSRGIYEVHVLLKWLDFYNKTSRRLFPLFYPFTFPAGSRSRGYGLAIKAVREV